jgi:hypothetical protein
MERRDNTRLKRNIIEVEGPSFVLQHLPHNLRCHREGQVTLCVDNGYGGYLEADPANIESDPGPEEAAPPGGATAGGCVAAST